MAVKTLTFLIIFLFTLSSLLPLATAQSSNTTTTTSPCPSPTGFVIRAALPSSPTLSIKSSFLSDHIIFFYTSQNILLSEAAFASFCLDQCIAYQPDPNATAIPETSLPPFFVTKKPGPCRSFTVDMGTPFPPTPNDTALRWNCEGYDRYLKEDLKDFEPVEADGSYMHALAVNRGCGGGYRAF